MRTTKDLIDELDAEKGKFYAVALVVGFERTSAFVWAHEEGRLEKLNKAVEDGGEPIGLIGFVKEHDHGGTFHTRPLAEHAGEEVAENYLTKLIDGIARTMGVDMSQVRKQKGWLN